MLHYFKMFRDKVFKDEHGKMRHPESREDCEKLDKVWRDYFVNAYAEFKSFNEDYEIYRDDQSGYNDEAKYPWGYKAKFEDLENILKQFATGKFNFGYYPNVWESPTYDWEAIYGDVKYALTYRLKVKIPQLERRKRTS